MGKYCQFLMLTIITAFSVLFVSCGDNSCDKDEMLKTKIKGDWYAVPDGWKMTFYETTCVATWGNGTTNKYNYIIEGERLTVDKYSGISGVISYIDDDIMRIQRDGWDEFVFKRTPVHNGTGGNSGGNSGSEDNIPYESYIKYSYANTIFIHELKYAESKVELAPAGTIQGCNWKHLSFFIEDNHWVFSLDSAYYLDEIPTNSWPTCTYNINSYDASLITNKPTARVSIYSDKLKHLSFYPVKGKASISYIGNTLIFDFKNSEGEDVEVHFKGKCY